MITTKPSKFEVMYATINIQATSKIQDVVEMLNARPNRDENADFVLFVAKSVLNERKVGA